MKPYRKAIAAFLTGCVAVAAMFVPEITNVVTPEVIASAATVIGTIAVYAFKNEEA